MSVVEVSLRVPNMKVRALDENGYPIEHSAVRFKRLVSVATIPKPGDSLPLATRSGRTLESTVVRSDWNEEAARFIVACQYANRSISAEDYAALINDPDWEMKPLI
jgi:hypothetical protein